MKLLVFSDSHGMPLYMRETLEKHRDVDAVIFLGDGQNDFQMMRALFPNIAFSPCAATVTSAAQTCRYAKF